MWECSYAVFANSAWEVAASIHSTHYPLALNHSVTINLSDTYGTRRALNQFVQVGEAHVS
jgi:hypothetical protein